MFFIARSTIGDEGRENNSYHQLKSANYLFALRLLKSRKDRKGVNVAGAE